MARILVLGGAGAMGSVAVADLLRRSLHEVIVADINPEPSAHLGAAHSDRFDLRTVDIKNEVALRRAIADVDVVLNTTYTGHTLAVTRAAIDSGVHMLDLGAYQETTIDQLALDPDARAAGVRIVPGCGAGPGLNNVIARYAADKLDSVDSIEIYTYLDDPITMSPGIVLTRFESSRGSALMLEDGEFVERKCFDESKIVEFAQPVGQVRVHYLPHPEILTIPRFVRVDTVVYMLGYGEAEERLLQALLDLGLDRGDHVQLQRSALPARELAAALIGARGIACDRENVTAKHIVVSGARNGQPTRFVYDLVLACVGKSASAQLTGACAAIGADLLSRDGVIGVIPPEGAFDAESFLASLARRGIHIEETCITKTVGVAEGL